MRGRRLSVGLLSAAGVVAGHVLTYTVAVPDHHERLELLASTGHGYWPSAVVVALAALIGATALWMAHGLPDRGWQGLNRLLILQCGGFLAMEVGESLLSGGHLSDRPLSLLAVGLICQVLVASASALIIGLARVVAQRSMPTRPRPRAHVTWSASLIPAPVTLRAEIVFNRLVARGPPLTV